MALTYNYEFSSRTRELPLYPLLEKYESGDYQLFTKTWNAKTLDLSGAKKTYTHLNYSGFETGTFQYEHDTGEPSLVYLELSTTTITMHIVSKERNEKEIEEIVKWAQTLAPKFEEKDPDKVSVAFWRVGTGSGKCILRSLTVPTWPEIELNYTADVTHELDKFMSTEWRPTQGGHLILWHGEPGTGKTTALRALSNQWREWCDIHYITDPEQFFGKAGYMLELLLDKEDESEKWKLFVLEDCGELLTLDAKNNSGQALSRLLNTVDGMIGQGLRFMILITTNEPFSKMHPAIQRPGRCVSNLEFTRLNHEEIMGWCEANDVTFDKTRATIADLYAEKESFNNRGENPKQLVGFGAR
jgi:hypothetical protein